MHKTIYSMSEDITFCGNITCGSRNICLRFTTNPTSKYAAYDEFTPDENGKCEYFKYDEKAFQEEFKKRIVKQ